MSKRKQFRRLRDLQDNLVKYNAFSVYGYFPLFDSIDVAIEVSPVSSYHIHEFEGVEYYMPDGLEMGKTQFHGDYKPPTLIEDLNIEPNHYHFTYEDNSIESVSKQQPPQLVHQWCVCAVSGVNNNMSPPTYQPSNFANWTCGDVYHWPRSFWITANNPFNPPWSNPPTNLMLKGLTDAFYDYICAQIGQTSLTLGQQIIMDSVNGNAFCTWGYVSSVNRLCIVYRGLQQKNGQHYVGFPGGSTGGWNFTASNCCEGFPFTGTKTSWDCVQKGDHPKFGFECKEIQGFTGPYANKQECIDSGCEDIDPDTTEPLGPITGVLNPQPKLGVVETVSTEVIIYLVYGGGGSSSALDNGAEQSSAFNIFRFYPDTQTHAPMSGPSLGNDNDIAASGNFIYQYDTYAGEILVFEADYVANTYTSLASISFPTGVLIHGSNSHTVIKNGDILVTYDFLGNLRFWDISGGPGSTCSLLSDYYIGIGSTGDLTYHPDTDSFILMWGQNAALPTPPPPFNSGSGIAQIDMQGNILNSNVTITSAATFRWKGDIYMFGTGGIRKVDINTLTSQVFDPLPFTNSFGGPFSHVNANGANETLVDIARRYPDYYKKNFDEGLYGLSRFGNVIPQKDINAYENKVAAEEAERTRIVAN